MRLLCAALIVFATRSSAYSDPPRFVRVFPLGVQTGATTSVEILGDRLAGVRSVEFDTEDIVWKGTTSVGKGSLVGAIAIAKTAAPGLHSFRLLSPDGPSNSGLIQVGAFPSAAETEPNDSLAQASAISSFPVDIQGRLDKAPDADVFRFSAKKRERLVFDLKAIEDGSAVETRLLLFDQSGRQLAFNDDRDDFNENPLLEYTFPEAGTYYVKVDQYRGPRGFNFGKLCAYILRIGNLPVVSGAMPRALGTGGTRVLRIEGSGLQSVQTVFLTKMRLPEFSHMTFPYTTPIRFVADPRRGTEVNRIEGRVSRRTPGAIEVKIAVPSSAAGGLWRIGLAGPNGPSEAGALEITDWQVSSGTSATKGALSPRRMIVTGTIAQPAERDRYAVQVHKGETAEFWTLAEQLGVHYLDSVITVRDATGRKLAESDDVVAGQGTLLGNADSRLFFTPETDGVVTVEVRDRTGRGGSGFEYCLKADVRKPGFQLFTTPENLTVSAGSRTEVKVHLVREPGFTGEVEISLDRLPAGATASAGRFRADQLFEPNADGADMVIPEIALEISVPPTASVREYAIRVLGKAANDGAQVVEAHSALMLGPILDAWNFVRRPLPAITMTVIPASVEAAAVN